MSGARERRQLLFRRSDIFRVLTQMSYKGWDNYKTDDYVPLESELERIQARLALLKELEDHLTKSRDLASRFRSD